VFATHNTWSLKGRSDDLVKIAKPTMANKSLRKVGVRNGINGLLIAPRNGLASVQTYMKLLEEQISFGETFVVSASERQYSQMYSRVVGHLIENSDRY